VFVLEVYSYERNWLLVACYSGIFGGVAVLG